MWSQAIVDFRLLVSGREGRGLVLATGRRVTEILSSGHKTYN